MAIIEDGYGKSLAGETAEQKAARKWKNHEVAKRFREELAICKRVPQERIITPSDCDIETREQRRAKRIRTATELRRQIGLLQDIIRSGRNTITEATIAGYRAQLEHQKRRLLVEKLRRLEAQQEG
jgi:hypothetical protein